MSQQTAQAAPLVDDYDWYVAATERKNPRITEEPQCVRRSG